MAGHGGCGACEQHSPAAHAAPPSGFDPLKEQVLVDDDVQVAKPYDVHDGVGALKQPRMPLLVTGSQPAVHELVKVQPELHL